MNSPRELDNLEHRLNEAKAHNRGSSGARGDEQESTAAGIAMRLGMEMVLSVVVAVVIGWGLDEWLGTAPWLLLVFLPLGIVAGILNVVRAARGMQHPRLKQ